MNEQSPGVLIVISGLIGTFITVCAPLVIRHYFDLSSRREDDKDRATRMLDVLLQMNGELYQRYEELYVNMIDIENLLIEDRKDNPNHKWELWEVSLHQLSLKPKLPDKLGEYIKGQLVANSSLGRTEQVNNDQTSKA